MNVLSLFSGIGGLELGLERAGMTVVGQVEIDPFCRRVLTKHWPEVPKHDDVRTCVEWWGSTVRPAVDVVCGGFPCQPFSTAGQRQGLADERWGWPWLWDVVRVVRPRFILVENVAALLRDRDAFGIILTDLAAGGYDADWDCIPAAAVGAPHRRDRLFLVAHAQRDPVRLEPIAESGRRGEAVARRDGAHGNVADPHSERLAGSALSAASGRDAWTDTHGSGAPVADADGSPRPAAGRPGSPILGSAAVERLGRRGSGLGEHWAAEPGMGRVAHGVPARMDRLRSLGNAVVPQVAEHVGRLVMAAAT
jgi:DNA (cytosine-5)-methyltransferase 1